MLAVRAQTISGAPYRSLANKSAGEWDLALLSRESDSIREDNEIREIGRLRRGMSDFPVFLATFARSSSRLIKAT